MLGRSRRLASWSGVAHPAWIRGGRCDRGADFAGCADERGVGAAGWVGQLAPTFRHAIPRHLACLQRRRQPLDHVDVDMAFSGGGFGEDACGAGDECLHAGHPNQIGRIRTGGQGAVCLNLPGSQGCLEPFGRCRRLQPGFAEVGGCPNRYAAAASCSNPSNRAIMP